MQPIQNYSIFSKQLKSTKKILISLHEIHQNINDSYLLVILPRLLKFSGLEEDLPCKEFFVKFVKYASSVEDYTSIKFRNKLMPKKFVFEPHYNQNSFTAYMSEVEKINRSMEPYRSIFHLAEINLVSYELQTGTLTDNRSKYYQTYVKTDITPTKKKRCIGLYRGY